MYLRTIFGILSNFYSGSLDLPFYSTVQGNRAALALWLIVSIFLVRYLYIKGIAEEYRTIISSIIYKLIALLYVNDTDLLAMNSGKKTSLEVILRAQKLLDTWQYSLRVTGSELKL